MPVESLNGSQGGSVTEEGVQALHSAQYGGIINVDLVKSCLPCTYVTKGCGSTSYRVGCRLISSYTSDLNFKSRKTSHCVSRMPLLHILSKHVTEA